MSLRKTLGRLFVFAFMEVSALMGAPITPDQIEALMATMRRTKIVHILRTENDKDPLDR